MLRKYLAWLSSTATLVVLSSFILPEGFVQIADWFGPVLGPTFRPELHLFFLLIGPSLSYTPLLLTWVVAGVVGGFFARGILRSMAAGTLSVLALILLVVGNGFLMFNGFRNLTGGGSGFSLPPPPQGFSLVGVLNAPIISQVLQGATAGGEPNILGILAGLVLNFVLNTAIYAAAFITSGFIFSKVLRSRPRTVPPPPPPPSPPADVAKPQSPTGTASVCLLLLLLLASALTVPTGYAQGSGFPESFSGEQLTLDLQKDGSLRMLYFTNASSLPGIPTDYQREEFQGMVAGFLFAFNGSIDLGPDSPLAFLLPLLPETGFMAVYQVADPSLGKTRADLLASEFGQGFGITLVSAVSMGFQSFGGQQIPGGGIYLSLYTGDGTPRSLGARVLSLVQSDGVGSILTPEKVFVNQYGVLAGFVNFDFQNATASPRAMLGVVADITPLGSFFGRGSFTLGLREVFGSQGTIGPSLSAKSTQIQLFYPANFTVTDYGPLTASNATLGQLQFSMNTTDSAVSNVYVTFNGVFPQRIEIDRQLDPQPPLTSGTTTTEKITVQNLGNETIRSVMVSEKRLFQTYPTLQLLSPSYNVTLGDIPAQGSAEATLQFTVGSDGAYTLPPVEVTYLDQGETIRKTSSRAYMQSSFNLIRYLGELVSGTAPYSYLFLALVLLPPILEVVKLGRRSRSSRRPPPGPVSVPQQSTTTAGSG